MLIESKSNLAKLMATENIIVEQRNVSTAHFNLGTRTLVVPTLKSELSGVLYDLFIGHEVGHALNTPSDGWHDSVKDMGVNRSVLNVCEDVRIEKLIRRKYPGLRMSFIKAYRELLDQDFFGVKGKNLDVLKFIDRLNLHSKCGASLGIVFNQDEMALVKEAEDAETFEETVEVAKKIQQLMKEQMEERKAKQAKEPVEEDGEPGDEGSEDFMEDEEGETQEGDSEEDYGTQTGDDPLESDTDNEFRKREQDLYQTSGQDTSYGNIPSFNSDDLIIDFKQVYKEIKAISDNLDYDDLMQYEKSSKIDNSLFVKFRKDSNKVVSYLAKEFELRKNAEQMKKASVAKTGDLNMNRIYSYQFTEDIFKKISVVPNGKSHGLVLFLDWSGSMSNYMFDTVKQLLTLVLFCKKVSIPFEVYAFSDQYRNRTNTYDRTNNKIKYKEGDILLQEMNLLNVLSSRMNSSELSFAGSVLLSNIFRYGYYDDYRLGSTPLNETIIAAMDIIPKFQKKYKLQVVNTVFLTDGEGHGLGYTFSEKHGRQRSYNMIVRDPVTQAQMRYNNHISDNSKAFLYLLKQRTQCNVVGFRILSGRDMKSYLHNIYGNGDTDAILSEFRKTKSTVIKSAGFDEYYLLRADKMATDEDDELEVKSTTTRGLVSAFKQYTKGHIQNRVILNRFIGLIS